MSTARKKKLKYAIRRIPLFVLYVLRKIGIRITPLLVVRGSDEVKKLDAGTFHMGFEGADSIDEILVVEPGSDRSELSGCFTEGNLCYGVREGKRLIAKMWCDLEAFHYPLANRRLEKGEAYLYAACVLDEYRGQDIAVVMASECCNALREMGFTRFYSTTFYFNYAARRFKEKRGSTNESLELHIDLFGKWSRTWTLKRYS